MGRYILIRLVSSIPVVIGVLIAVFIMVRLVPGDPVKIMFENRGRPNPEQEAALREQLGLDLPIYEQFARFTGNVLQGDLGQSFRSKRPVSEEIEIRLPNTLKLAGAALLFSIIVGCTLGIISATHKGTWIDVSSTIGA
ncbi:MAG: ABC transporter permease, partial [Thermomicrobiales bacterium]